MRRFPNILKNTPYFLHGADYNPDQWQEYPEILEADLKLMDEAACNIFTLGVFAWTSYEPEEGKFQFDWLDRTLDALHAHGKKAFLATPTGAKPAWLHYKYPEVSRTGIDGTPDPYQHRHNHCMTSPIYREKAAIINQQLAKRYHNHPAFAGWHISNEYGGDCYCDLCISAFQNWLKEKYQTIENLNREWWAPFWNHTYSDWSEINPRDGSLDCQHLEWSRFVTAQTTDFFRHEVVAVREFSKEAPVTTNFMGFYKELNYWEMADVCDFISTDSYPQYIEKDDFSDKACAVSMSLDMLRAMKKGKPFLMMEACVNGQSVWMPTPKLKRPGVHALEMIQAISHGADGTLYFQWRKGRGGCEKYHGSIVDHDGTNQTRVFKEVAEYGNTLPKLEEVLGTTVDAKVAVIFDWENYWAIRSSRGINEDVDNHLETVQQHYRPFWERGISVDVINAKADLSGYSMVIAPELYMIDDTMGARLTEYAKNGGTLVLTYLAGMVNENNICHIGGWPGPQLREVAGVWAEEFDFLKPEDSQSIRLSGSFVLPKSNYVSEECCMLINAEGAEVLATYGEDFYAGRPALTRNHYGKGTVYYIAAKTKDSFVRDFYAKVLRELEIKSPFPSILPDGLSLQVRTDGEQKYYFLLNFVNEARPIELPEGQTFTNLIDGSLHSGSMEIAGFGSAVLKAT